MENTFGNLYDYITSRGIIIPQTSTIKSKVDECFKSIFGNDFDLDPTTIGGRLAEAISLLFVDIIGVNAQSASMLNPNRAIGSALDNIAALFGITRQAGMDDSKLRNIILSGQSSGVGFYQSVVNAISKVDGVNSVCVLNNGNADPCMISGISVQPHSVYIAVGGGDDTDIADAILNAMPVGCGYTDSDESAHYGVKVEKVYSNSRYNSNVIFYRPTTSYFKVKLKCVNNSSSDEEWQDYISTEIKSAIVEYFKSHSSNSTLTKSNIIASLIAKNIDADITFEEWSYRVGTTGNFQVIGESIEIGPAQQAAIAESDITVEF